MSQDLVVFDDEKVAIIKEMFCKNATKTEFELFIHMAKRLQLDPVCKQIYFIKYGTQMTIVVGIDGYRAIAERTGVYMPGKEPTFVHDEKGNLVSCTAYVKRWSERDRHWHEIAATAYLSEYDTGKNQWAKGRHYMLAKTAEALAIRKGFPSQLSGTNTEEEMEKAIIDVTSSISKTQELSKKINQEQANEVVKLIGDDVEYKERILKYYKAPTFMAIDATELETILERVHKHNEERLKQETEMVNV